MHIFVRISSLALHARVRKCGHNNKNIDTFVCKLTQAKPYVCTDTNYKRMQSLTLSWTHRVSLWCQHFAFEICKGNLQLWIQNYTSKNVLDKLYALFETTGYRIDQVYMYSMSKRQDTAHIKNTCVQSMYNIRCTTNQARPNKKVDKIQQNSMTIYD